MIHVVRAELVRLLRRRPLLAAAAGTLLFAIVAPLAVFLSADEAGPRAGRTPTLDSLAQPGGGTEAFALGISFTGLLVLVLVTATFTGEFSRGTIRGLVMREPRRVRLLAGTTTAMLGFAAVLLAAAAAASWVGSTAFAAARDVPVDDWLTAAALGDDLAAYGRALVVVGCWLVFGTALGITLRSTPIALGVGVAWAGPFEHLLQDVWSGAERWFPGLLLEAVAAGGTDAVDLSRALPMALGYAALAASAAALVLGRRDVTG